MLFKRIVLIGRHGGGEALGTAHKVAAYLLSLGCEVDVEEDTAELMRGSYKTAELGIGYDLGVVVGGDGTMMGAARTWGLSGVPLIGVNEGRIGFLTDVPSDEALAKLSEILGGKHKREERGALNVRLIDGDKMVFEDVAINDLAVKHSNLSKLMEFSLFIDGEFVNTQHADGVIVATPTGSTAYALSAGGSLVHPSSNVLNIVPICPQSLSNRPLIVPEWNEIRIVPSDMENAYIALDGMEKKVSERFGAFVSIRKNERKATFLHPLDYSYFHGLRNKLNWG